MALRQVVKVVQGSKQMEGAGVQICRTVGTPGLRNLDPYLMLDELKLPSKAAAAGFPEHPHRGFETCSIMLEGQIEHEDSVGNKGVIGPGGVQWMTAGRGIIHSEMPRVTDSVLHGFQLWINLPKKDKMCKPRYQDYQAKDIPIVEQDNMSVRVMAGTSYGTAGPIKMRNPGMLLDVRLRKGAQFQQAVPEGWNGFAYVYEGNGDISGTQGKPQHALVLGPGDHITATTTDPSFKFMLIAGQPINEPIVQHGPFVMNTREEIDKAISDYRLGKLVSKSQMTKSSKLSKTTTQDDSNQAKTTHGPMSRQHAAAGKSKHSRAARRGAGSSDDEDDNGHLAGSRNDGTPQDETTKVQGLARHQAKSNSRSNRAARHGQGATTVDDSEDHNDDGDLEPQARTAVASQGQSHKQAPAESPPSVRTTPLEEHGHGEVGEVGNNDDGNTTGSSHRHHSERQDSGKMQSRVEGSVSAEALSKASAKRASGKQKPRGGRAARRGEDSDNASV